MRYKVGDKVVIRKDLGLVLGGKTTTITAIIDNSYYEIKEDDGQYFWNDKEIDHEATILLNKKIETIDDIKILYDEGKLTHFVVNNKCKDTMLYAYTKRKETLIIENFSSYGVYFKYTKSDLPAHIDFKYIDLEATEKLIKVGKEMTKSDLREGMVVETIGKCRRLVLGGKLIDRSGFIDLIDYEEDLIRVENSNDNIVKIYIEVVEGLLKRYLMTKY